MPESQSVLALQWAYGVSTLRHNVVNLSATSCDKILFIADNLVVIQVLHIHRHLCMSSLCMTWHMSICVP